MDKSTVWMTVSGIADLPGAARSPSNPDQATVVVHARNAAQVDTGATADRGASALVADDFFQEFGADVLKYEEILKVN